MTTRTLYRPDGLAELRLMEAADMRWFPKRLPEQPIFYPVLNREYARKIARDWNTKDTNGCPCEVGFVTEFDVQLAYLMRFEEQQVGDTIHRELWIPAEELETFNDHIVGQIRVIDVFYGEKYEGERRW